MFMLCQYYCLRHGSKNAVFMSKTSDGRIETILRAHRVRLITKNLEFIMCKYDSIKG